MKPKIALVSMPWTAVSEPSLGLGILKAQLTSEGIESRVFHLNLLLLRHVTGVTYQQISSYWALNEFVFTGALDEHISQDQADCLLERCHAQCDPTVPFSYTDPDDFGRVLIKLRTEIVPRYLNDCAAEILAYQPTMVGFTCLFDQTMAAAALARVLKSRAPGIQIVLGGYALEGPPGLEVLNAFPQVDAVAAGDGEPIIGAIARASAGLGKLEAVPGVLTRTNPSGLPRAKFELDKSPLPDYSDWFRDLQRAERDDKVKIITTVLPVESSRGCWWGQKQHCIFCGIDDETMSYRSKRAETVLSQLAEMRRLYGTDIPYRFSDYIFPHHFTNDLLPKLAEVEPRYVLHCEIKANQNDERIRAFANAGFTEMQPGIESFDTNVLKLMRKGVTGIQNVHTVKLGYRYGVLINYNILCAIPGEKHEWYLRMVDLLPRLYHLTPPVTRTETIVTRFAPLQTDPSFFNIATPPRHHRCYDSLFSQEFLQETGFCLDNYAYYFERPIPFDVKSHPTYRTLIFEVDHWKKLHTEREVELSFELDDNLLHIKDTRFDEPREFELNEDDTTVYLACDGAPQTLAALARQTGLSPERVSECVSSLDREALVWIEDELVLGLATPANVFDSHRDRQWHRLWTSVYT